MAYKIIVTPTAHNNIIDAEDYYFSEAGLDIVLNFYNELQNCYAAIEINPFYQVRVKNL
jgi:ABC-type tungstate transport system permease subunit